MSTQLALLSCGQALGSDQALAKLAEVMGVRVAMLDVGSGGTRDALVSALSNGHRCFAARIDCLMGLSRSEYSLIARFDSALIYGVSPERGSEELLAWLADGALGKPARTDRCAEYSIAGTRDFSAQLTGLRFSVDGGAERAAFTTSAAGGFVPIINCQARPWFALVRKEGCDVFLLSSDEVLDIDATATHDVLAPESYPALLPWLFFLRRAFGDGCWHDSRPRAALTIDDPTLRPHYGFLDYDRLLQAMQGHNFASTIAFIPWNYRRSSPGTVTMFRAHNDRLSICVHGCDHTGGEFAICDQSILRRQARTALERVRSHEKITGLACDPVMIFPQGLFSRAALSALKAEGYLAAVNTGVLAVDYGREILLRDLLEPAVTVYDGFPLFVRRSPKILQVALDLYLGRPILIVSHHDYFKTGYANACAFADQVNALDARISWEPLGKLLRSSALYRKDKGGKIEVKFYTDRFVLSNPDSVRRTYVLRKRVTPNSVSKVLCDGVPVEHRATDHFVEVELELEPGAVCTVELIARATQSYDEPHPSLTYKAKVAVRRYLSEFRDNYISRNDSLLAVAKRVKDLLVGHQ